MIKKGYEPDPRIGIKSGFDRLCDTIDINLKYITCLKKMAVGMVTTILNHAYSSAWSNDDRAMSGLCKIIYLDVKHGYDVFFPKYELKMEEFSKSHLTEIRLMAIISLMSKEQYDEPMTNMISNIQHMTGLLGTYKHIHDYVYSIFEETQRLRRKLSLHDDHDYMQKNETGEDQEDETVNELILTLLSSGVTFDENSVFYDCDDHDYDNELDSVQDMNSDSDDVHY